MSNRRRPKHPAVTAAADQAEAAAEDVSRRVRVGLEVARLAEAAETGRPPYAVHEGSGAPTGKRAEVLGRAVAALGAGIMACDHAAEALEPRGPARPSAAPALELVIWASWRPGELLCPLCAITGPRPDAATDYTCDGCGAVNIGGELQTCTYVYRADPERAARTGHLGPPVLITFALCPTCRDT